MARVWVVTGVEGEYSSRIEWVAGVYLDKASAVAAAEEGKWASAQYKALYQMWCDRQPRGFMFVGGPEPVGVRPEWKGPGNTADDYTVVECEVGVFGALEEIGSAPVIDGEAELSPLRIPCVLRIKR